MALVSSDRITTVERLMKQLEASRDPQAQEACLAELRANVKRCEERFGMSSDRVHAAIDAGELIEDLEVGHWLFQYDLLQSVEEE